MITIYLVYKGAYDDAGPVVGFTDPALADAHVERLKAEGEDAWVEPIQLMNRAPEKVPVYHVVVHREKGVRRWTEMVYDYAVAADDLVTGRAEATAVMASGKTTRGYDAAEEMARARMASR